MSLQQRRWCDSSEGQEKPIRTHNPFSRPDIQMPCPSRMATHPDPTRGQGDAGVSHGAVGPAWGWEMAPQKSSRLSNTSARRAQRRG